MLDLGSSFVASASRDPNGIALVDGDLRLTYRQWHDKISVLVASFDRFGLKPGDHVVTLLQNRWEAATLHWACQFAGIVITPINWRAKADELDFCIEDSEARAIFYQDVSAAAVKGSSRAGALRRVSVDPGIGEAISFGDMIRDSTADAEPRVGADAWSIMLYTSGTTSRPKGVPRRHRAERASAIAHVAQNLYGRGERTLGVMPLYHTMGVRSLLAMALIDGAFICQHHFDAAAALRHIARERITSLYLVPTLYHDLVGHPDFAACDTSSVTKLGFAG